MKEAWRGKGRRLNSALVVNCSGDMVPSLPKGDERPRVTLTGSLRLFTDDVSFGLGGECVAAVAFSCLRDGYDFERLASYSRVG